MTDHEAGPGSTANGANPASRANGDEPSAQLTDVELVTIRLIGLPVPMQSRAQEHADELTRELMLIGEQMRQRGDHAGLPARLVSLVESLTGQYSAFTGEQEQELADAAAAGVDTLDLTYTVPAAVADAARALDEILDEADEYCRAGEHLLTLPTPPDLVTYRRWFLDQFVDQVRGAPPVSFEDYRPSRERTGASRGQAGDAAGGLPASRR